MNRETLYRFFYGTATSKEGNEIRKHLEASDENWKEFLRERKLFDALLLNDNLEISGKPHNRNVLSHKFIREAIKVVAIFLFAIGISFLWMQESDNQDSKTVITTLNGQMANAILPDGTKVWLNSNTRLEYPVSFDRNKREVHVDGEVYFEVAHNTKKPFVVYTPQQENVEVMGTKFYVEAYSGQNSFETALMEGSVRVNAGTKSVFLLPLQRVVVKEGRMSVEKITDLDVYRWREGLICFKSKHFTEIIEGLKKYYGVNISITDRNIKNPQLTVKFRLSDGIEHALRVLQHDVRFSYLRDDEKNTFIIQK
ncbi:FecR family protein [Bacteroides fluxus]|uniref:FecR family protein n=1 Tax=Bacteroides fluxus TaxID=626930 RepID=UPI0023578647|nr:FecR domain-containing protein [Bacteroides fluxus]